MFLPDRNACYFGLANNTEYPDTSKEGRDLIDRIKTSAEASGKIKTIDHTYEVLPAESSSSYVLEILEGEANITLDHIPSHDGWARHLEKGDCAAAHPNTEISIEATNGFMAKIYFESEVYA